jgi:hypothetical protein
MLNLANSNTTVWSNGTSSNLTTLLNWTGYTTLNAAGISTPGGDYFAIKTQGTFTAAESGVYTFELHSPTRQPAGSINSSKISKFQLDLQVYPLPVNSWGSSHRF